MARRLTPCVLPAFPRLTRRRCACALRVATPLSPNENGEANAAQAQALFDAIMKRGVAETLASRAVSGGVRELRAAQQAVGMGGQGPEAAQFRRPYSQRPPDRRQSQRLTPALHHRLLAQRSRR